MKRRLAFFSTLLTCARWRCHVLPLLAAGCLLSAGCISRTLEIKTTPPGARVFVEGEEIGTTPAVYTFNHYGPRTLLLTLETQDDESVDYAPIEETIHLDCPWWGYFPIDLVAEIMPFTITDTHYAEYTMVNRQGDPKSLEAIQKDMNAMQDRLLED